ncbi:MAG TPA: redoxin domain-containing protein [Planctomicrobium sp.]|nr:redoxin domain-containing protein [Planctomicrobium sp.]
MGHIQKDLKSVRSVATKLFLGMLFLFAAFNFVAILYFQFRPESSFQASPSGFLDACRELCAKYGLVETGNVANDAKAFLAAAREDSKQNNSDHQGNTDGLVPSQDHPLIGKRAPNFTLSDDGGQAVRLSDVNRDGPVLVVFYYGYFCSHCVAQLFAIDEDLAKFSDAHTTVVAISADRSEHTAEMFREHGRFQFPVVSDEDRAVSVAYGCYRPQTPQADEDMLHGTFLIDRQGIVRWANTGYTPFLDNDRLLKVIQQMNGPASVATANERSHRR